MTIDHLALLPAYTAAATAVLVFLADLAIGRRTPVLVLGMLGAAATVAVSWWSYQDGVRSAFCDPCSYVWDGTAALVGALFGAATFVVLGLSVTVLRTLPAGEYAFLLACSMTGGVVLGASRDLITLIIALETLTLPVYVLVGLRSRRLASAVDSAPPVRSAEAAVTFFVVSVVSTSVTLLGAALLYAATGTVHLDPMAVALGDRPQPRLVAMAVVLVLVGLAFKVAAVPFHAWAPSTYDGAPLPVAAYLSTASKLGGVIALLLVAVRGLQPWLDVAGPALAVLAVLTMTVGNLAALRQRRMVRLLAWSSVAQAGYILAPLGALALTSGRSPSVVPVLVTAVLGYTVFYIVLELTAFGAVIALRGSLDGGSFTDYAGAFTRRPWITLSFVLAMTGLAGLPPGLAGLFAKVTVVRALLDAGAGWLALVVAINAVIGLAYYIRAAVALFGSAPSGAPASLGSVPLGSAPSGAPWPRVPIIVGAMIALVTLVSVIIGFAPSLVLSAV
jgi:NADH-quinone oxidoreductase subunit N